MLRIWLTCVLATGVIVAVVLALGKRGEEKPSVPTAPQAPPPLTEQEVRTYVELQPQITKELGDLAMQFQLSRVQNDGNVDEAAFQVRSQALIDSMLEKRHLTRETWEKLRKRVEYAVDVVRSVPELEEARPDLEEKIRMKEMLVGKLAKEDERAAVQKEIDNLKALLEGGGPPLSDEDRDLVRQYWRALNEAVPPRGPPKKPGR
ncbi:MAG TPA: hypothetical protein VFY93_04280 [Planctomycetota bacterium]|nr:hypothetical protein [Planctomycetota bacterium]